MPSFSTVAEAEYYSSEEKRYRDMVDKLYEKYLCEEIGIRTKITVRPETKDYIFLTINPPPHLDLTQFLKTIDKMLAKPWIGGYLYVIEQRDEPEIVPLSIKPGFHTHILIKLNHHVKPSVFTKELKNTWRTKLDVNCYTFFNLKNIDNKEQIKIQGYMLNWKDDDKKHDKQYGDDVYRKNNNLQRYYTYNYKIEQELRSTYFD